MKSKNLTVDWMMGFIDGDGYFGLECVKRKRPSGCLNLYFRPVLAISQNDIKVLYKIKKFVGCGTVSAKGKVKEHFHYRIRSAKDFLRFFCPLVENKSFQTSKQLQFLLLKKVCLFLITDYEPANQNHQLYLNEMVFELKKLKNQPYCNKETLTSDWFIGFFEAEGCFYFHLNDKNHLNLDFKVSQQNKCLLMKIQTFFGYGKIKRENQSSSVVPSDFDTTLYCFFINNFSVIETHLVPYLKKQTLHSNKMITKQKWLTVCALKSYYKTTSLPFSETDLKKLKRLKKQFQNRSQVS